MKILVFTEGTIIMHPSAKGLTREQRVIQSEIRERSIYDYKHYIPNDNAVGKLQSWKKQGAEIYYLTSRTSPEQIGDIASVLAKYAFPDYKNLLSRKEEGEYKDVAEHLMPDILIEDDCESIGEESEMTYPHISKDLKKQIKPIIVKEFGGIDHLPDNVKELITYVGQQKNF